MEAPCCPSALIKVIKETVLPSLTLGKEGRKGESAVLYIFAALAALSDQPPPDDLPSNTTLAACQHLVI